MLKRQIPKRKIKQTLNKIVFSCAVFFVTFCLLLSYYLLSQIKKTRIISPAPVRKNIAVNKPMAAGSDSYLVDSLKKLNINIKDETPSSSDSSTMVITDNGEVLVFSGSKSFQGQIASLQLIMRQLTIEGRRFKRIDFRFDNPVIVF